MGAREPRRARGVKVRGVPPGVLTRSKVEGPCWEQWIWVGLRWRWSERVERRHGEWRRSNGEREGRGGPLTSVRAWVDEKAPALSCPELCSSSQPGSEEAGFSPDFQGLVTRFRPKEDEWGSLRHWAKWNNRPWNPSCSGGSEEIRGFFLEKERSLGWGPQSGQKDAATSDNTWQERGSFDKSRGIWS